MSDVVKKGFLEVKKRNLFGSAYKEKYIILRNSADHKCKVVEIQDSEDGDDTRETVKLNDSWTVQDRPSKSRGKYTFELLMCEEAILTFGCGTFIEREEWTEAFRILNQLAPAFVGSQPLPTTIVNDYFSVNLIKNRSAMEINHSGPYVLSITTSAIILHWRTMAIAHQWPRRSIKKLYHPKREGRLILNTQRPAGGPPTEFEFVADDHNALQILKLWNIRLLESIPRTQQQFTDFKSSKSHSVKERRSFRTPKAASRVNDNDLKRAGSFSKMHTLGTGLVGGVLPGRRSWGGSNEIYPPPIPNGSQLSQLSQDSMFSSLTSPPPLPPRPVESDSDEEDPDYAYIDENKVKGPENQRVRSKTLSASGSGRVASPSLDDQLEELKKSIMRENKKKKRDKAAERKAATLHFVPSRSSPRGRIPLDIPRADPEDYLEPVASKRITSTSSEGVPRRHKNTSGNRLSLNAGESANSMSQSLSDHGANTNHSSSSSIGTSACEVFDDSQTPPDVHGGSTAGLLGNPPALPPRPWRNSTSSVSSATSPSSTVPPSASSGLVSNRTSISEEKLTVHEEEEPHKSPSPTAERRNSGSGDRTPEAVPAEATPSGNGRQMALSSSSKDGSTSPIDASSSSTSPPPPLPPRSPTRDRERLSRKSSSSSVSSNTSCSRCHRCRSVKKTTKAHVVKTISLDPRGGVQGIQSLTKEENRKSLPDLNNASPVPENSLAHHRQHQSHSASREHHSCSKCSVGSGASTDGLQPAANSNGSLPSSSSQQNFASPNNEYLQLVNEEVDKKGSTQPEDDHDVFSSCLQDLQRTIDEFESTSNSPNLSSKATTAASYNPRTAVQSEFEAAKRRAEMVQAELSLPGRSVQRSSTSPDERIGGVANGHPPLLKKQNTSLLASSSSSSSPLTSGSSLGSSGPLHWTQQPQPQNARPRGHTNGTVVRQTSGSSIAGGSTPTRVSPPLSLSQQSFHLPAGGPGLSHPVGGALSYGGGAAPPVPPRSQVSLGEVQSTRGQPHGHVMGRSFSQMNTRSQPPQQRPLNKTTSLGRHMTSWSHAHPGPQRGVGMSPGMVSGAPPPSSFHNHIEPQSATVFVHHLTRTNSRQRQMRAHLV